jgi:hypothetical protein
MASPVAECADMDRKETMPEAYMKFMSTQLLSNDTPKSGNFTFHPRDNARTPSTKTCMTINSASSQQQALRSDKLSKFCFVTNSCFEVDQSYNQNMKRVADFVEIQSKHAPKFISNFNRVDSLELGLPVPTGNYRSHFVSTVSPMINCNKSNPQKQPGTIEMHPASTKKYFMQLQMPCQIAGCSMLEPPTSDPSIQMNIYPATNPQVSDEIDSVMKKLIQPQDAVETISRDAQVRARNRHATKLVKNTLSIAQSHGEDEGTDENWSVKSEAFDTLEYASKNNEPAKGLGNVQGIRPEKPELDSQFKENFKEDRKQKAMINVKSLRVSRASTDKSLEVRNPLFKTDGLDTDVAPNSSTKSILLVRTRFQPGSSKIIFGRNSGQEGSQDNFQSTKKKVAFAKNKMVLLFEKGY